MPTVPCHIWQSNALLAAVWVPVIEPASPNAARILHLFVAVFLICVAIFLIVVTLICFSVIRFRAVSSGLPRQDFGDHRAEIIWTIPPGVIVLGLALYSARLILSITALPSMAAPPAGDPDLVVVGHQWWWEVRYPASGAVTANEIHVPVGRRLRVELKSADVIHSFWVQSRLAKRSPEVPEACSVFGGGWRLSPGGTRTTAMSLIAVARGLHEAFEASGGDLTVTRKQLVNKRLR